MTAETLYPRYASRAASNSVPVTGDISIGENLGAEYIDLRNVTTLAGPAQDTVIKYWIRTAVALEWGTATVTVGGMLTNRVAAGQIIEGVEQVTITTLIDVTTDDQIYWFNPEKEFDLDAAIATAESSRDATLAVEATATASKDNVLALEQQVISSKNISDSNAAFIQANKDAANAVIQGIGAAFFKNMSQSANFVDGVIFNTEAWRERTRNTSWYGVLGKMPKKCGGIAETNKLSIRDFTDTECPAWMDFDSELVDSVLTKSIETVSAVAFGGCCLWIGTDYGLTKVDFIRDTVFRYRTGNGFSWAGTYKGSIDQRNSGKGFSKDIPPTAFLVNNVVNGIAVTTVAGAEIDPATGLPYPTIAVATDGGVSIINPTGTAADVDKVVNITFTENSNGLFVDVDEDEILHVSQRLSGGGNLHVHSMSIPTANTVLTSGANSLVNSLAGSSGTYLRLPTSGDPFDTPLVKGRAIGFGSGLAMVDLDKSNLPTTLPNSLFAIINTTYNTGWMHGDIRGCWMADSVAGTITGTELVSNGGFDTDTSGWTAVNSTLSTVSGAMRIADAGGGSAAYQAINVVVGKTYILSFDLVAATGGSIAYGVGGAAPDGNSHVIGGSGQFNETIPGVVSLTFTATNSTMYLSFGSTGTYSVDIDNVTVREAIPDRSVKGNGLAVYGGITVTPAAVGCDSMMFGPFSTSIYAEQPYNSDLDPATDDFAWFVELEMNPNTTLEYIFERANAARSIRYALRVTDAGVLEGLIDDGTALLDTVGSTVVDDGQIRLVGLARRGANLEVWVNDKVESALIVNATGSLDVSDGTLTIGANTSHTEPLTNGRLGRLRPFKSVPTAEQIRKIYNDEKWLFRENAQSTLGGSSNVVQALAYDEDTELLYVGKDDGLDVRQGLLRLEHRHAANSNFTDNNIKSISASGGDLLITTGVEAYFDKEADEL